MLVTIGLVAHAVGTVAALVGTRLTKQLTYRGLCRQSIGAQSEAASCD